MLRSRRGIFFLARVPMGERGGRRELYYFSLRRGEHGEVFYFSRGVILLLGEARRTWKSIFFTHESLWERTRRSRRVILFLAGCYIIARGGVENTERYFFHARVPMGENAEAAESYIISPGVLYYCSQRRGGRGELYYFSHESLWERTRRTRRGILFLAEERRRFNFSRFNIFFKNFSFILNGL